MKILVCGKGGSGKSTISALLSYSFIAAGNDVILVDTDESNTGLHRLVGTSAPRDLMEYLGGKKQIIEQWRANMDGPGLFAEYGDAVSLDAFPDQYVTGAENIKLVSIGKIHDFGEGCACPMGILAKQFISKLATNPGEIVIVDTEAGIEHFGRGIEEGVDAIIMVLDPSYESILLANQVSELLKDRALPLYYLLNKVNEGTSARITASLPDADKVIGTLSNDEDILLTGLEGASFSKGHAITDAIVKKYFM